MLNSRLNNYVNVPEVWRHFARLVDAAVAVIAAVVNLTTVVLLSVLRRI